MELPKELTGRLYSERGAVVHSEVNSVIKTDHGKYLLVVKKTELLVVCCYCAQIFAIDVNVFLDNMNKGVFVPVGLLNEISMAFVLRAGQTCPMLSKVEQEYFK